MINQQQSKILSDFENFFTKLSKGKRCGCNKKADLWKAYVLGLSSGWGACIDSDWREALGKFLSDINE